MATMARREKKESPPVTRASARYLALVRACPLRPIRNEAELDRAIAMLDSLIDRGRRDEAEEDFLVVLAGLVEAFEDVHYPMGAVSGVEMLRYLIETHGTTQAAVAAGSGVHVATISNILAGRRRMTLQHIEALGRFFHVGPAVFLPDPDLKPARRSKKGRR